jgi:hypothetical protein
MSSIVVLSKSLLIFRVIFCFIAPGVSSALSSSVILIGSTTDVLFLYAPSVTELFSGTIVARSRSMNSVQLLAPFVGHVVIRSPIGVCVISNWLGVCFLTHLFILHLGSFESPC